MAALLAATREYSPAIARRHALQEAVHALASAVVRLVRPLHETRLSLAVGRGGPREQKSRMGRQTAPPYNHLAFAGVKDPARRPPSLE
jgi:hypothetical protein